jgi:4-alpha-glucanotransferase
VRPFAFPRSAGVTVPLFSLRRRNDWGIGTIGALAPFAAFVAKQGFSLVQILPPHELPPGEASPYGARTAFALDPIYLDVEALPELTKGSLDEALGADGRDALAYARRAERVDYTTVRACKDRALTAAFAAFDKAPAARREAFAKFCDEERGWLEDHALYVASAALHRNGDWRTWLGKLRDREPAALAQLALEQKAAVARASYEQFCLFEAWAAMRAELAKLEVALMGDLPFIVGHASVDAWARPREFNRERSLGAPPDGFSPEGQDWGLPSFDWSAMDATDLAWVRARTRHAAKLYDCFRVDHVIGLFRQWTKGPGEKMGSFDPKTEPEQIARGRKVLSAMVDEAGAGSVIAEDLGVIPDWARKTLHDLRIPGYKVLPWEKDGRGFLREPKGFQPLSVATWSTHDTAPITQWWDDFSAQDRAAWAERAGGENLEARLRVLFEAGSNLCLVQIQELLGDRTRTNEPGTVGGHNWTNRLPLPIEGLLEHEALGEFLGRVRGHLVATGRTKA